MIKKSLSAQGFLYLENLEGGQSRDLWGGEQSRDIFRGGPVKKTPCKFYKYFVQNAPEDPEERVN